MAGFPIYVDGSMPYPIVDHPHERTNQHNTFLGVLARKPPNQTKHPNQPDVDISDNTHSYEIDIEVPGIQDPNSIGIFWPSLRTLIVTGTTTRPRYVNGQRVPDEPADGETSERSNDEALLQRSGTASSNGQEAANLADTLGEMRASTKDFPPLLMHGERRIGYFRREFHFIGDMEMEKLKATLEAGLLHIHLPKKWHSRHTGSTKVHAAETTEAPAA